METLSHSDAGHGGQGAPVLGMPHYSDAGHEGHGARLGDAPPR